MSYYSITMDINELRQGYERRRAEKRYQLVDTEISKEYFDSAEKDLQRAQKELLENNFFWSLAALDSAVTQVIYGLSIKEKGLRPKSRICAENLVCSENLINEKDYKVIIKIRELRNKTMYDAVFRKDLNRKDVIQRINDFEDLFFKKVGKR
jgi:hypothetical protein